MTWCYCIKFLKTMAKYSNSIIKLIQTISFEFELKLKGLFISFDRWCLNVRKSHQRKLCDISMLFSGCSYVKVYIKWTILMMTIIIYLKIIFGHICRQLSKIFRVSTISYHIHINIQYIKNLKIYIYNSTYINFLDSKHMWALTEYTCINSTLALILLLWNWPFT